MNDIVSSKPENHHSNGHHHPLVWGGGGKLVWPVLRVALNLEKSTVDSGQLGIFPEITVVVIMSWRLSSLS